MLALRMRQKDAEFYFASFPAEDLLKKVKFVSRFYGERGEAVGGVKRKEMDDIERYLSTIERSSTAFQRDLNRRKIRQIRDFFLNESNQPILPGAILLFTQEELKFHPMKDHERMGDLSEPRGEFLIIDGQHRLAGLNFYGQEPDADKRLEIPCVIFDGKTSEFATEMFVVINSTHTRINKSHLIDLYEKIEWGTDDEKKYASSLVRSLYEEPDSPLRYHINMLGGRSTQDLWINQAQIFGEVYKLIQSGEVETYVRDERGWNRQSGYRFLRDLFRASKNVFGEAWGDNKNYMVTRDVTLKALVRIGMDVARNLSRELEENREERESVLIDRFQPWSEMVRDFRREGFYERFPAKGQVERVAKIRKSLAQKARLEK